MLEAEKPSVIKQLKNEETEHPGKQKSKPVKQETVR